MESERQNGLRGASKALDFCQGLGACVGEGVVLGVR